MKDAQIFVLLKGFWLDNNALIEYIVISSRKITLKHLFRLQFFIHGTNFVKN